MITIEEPENFDFVFKEEKSTVKETSKSEKSSIFTQRKKPDMAEFNLKDAKKSAFMDS